MNCHRLVVREAEAAGICGTEYWREGGYAEKELQQFAWGALDFWLDANLCMCRLNSTKPGKGQLLEKQVPGICKLNSFQSSNQDGRYLNSS